jgi:hypothetical protein
LTYPTPHIYSGTNTSLHKEYTGTLSITTNLIYDEEYWLLAEADAEVYGATVPVPGTLLLFGLGLVTLIARRRS